MHFFKIKICEHSLLVIWNREIPNGLFRVEISIVDTTIESELAKNPYGYVIILAELSWNGKKYSDFYGFDVACELRLKHKLLIPIVIVSFMPETFFKDNYKYNILKARGTDFLQLPFEPEELIKSATEIRLLTPAALADISSLLLNSRYLIDRFTHDIRFESDKDSIIAKAKNILSDLPVDFQKNYSWDESVSKLAENNLSEEEFYLRKKEIILKLNSLLIPNFEDLEASKKYRILLLEDNEEDAQIIMDALHPFYEITHISYGEEAVRMIDLDEVNEFQALICDWRLLKPGTDKQQNWQGYEVMEYAASKRFYAMFSLTSLDDDSRKLISPYISCSFTPLTKDFEKGSSLWRILIPIINQRIEENLSILAGLPTGEGWYKQDKADYKKDSQGNKQTIKKGFASFHQQYLNKRNSSSFVLWNNDISDISSRIWKYYKLALAPESDRSLQDISTKWGIELNRDVRNVLVLRRLYLAFWYNQSRLEIAIRVKYHREYHVIENPVVNIYSVLRKKYWDDALDNSSGEEEFYKKLLSAAKAFVSQLALEPKSLPAGILPEEKAWLYSIGIDIKHGNDVDYYLNDDE